MKLATLTFTMSATMEIKLSIAPGTTHFQTSLVIRLNLAIIILMLMLTKSSAISGKCGSMILSQILYHYFYYMKKPHTVIPYPMMLKRWNMET